MKAWTHLHDLKGLYCMHDLKGLILSLALKKARMSFLREVESDCFQMFGSTPDS